MSVSVFLLSFVLHCVYVVAVVVVFSVKKKKKKNSSLTVEPGTSPFLI